MKKDGQRSHDIPDQVLLTLFRGPALGFSRTLRANMDRDPRYVENHKREIFVELDWYLRQAGVVLDESSMDEQLFRVVREVVGRLRSYELNEDEVRMRNSESRIQNPEFRNQGSECGGEDSGEASGFCGSDVAQPNRMTGSTPYGKIIMNPAIFRNADALMTRQPNTTINGKPFDQETIEKVWAKGRQELWFTFFKRDACGASIEKDEFGKETEYGWEIDHIVPVAMGGTDDLGNLQPLHWENNRSKGNDYPHWECKVRW
jgi:hypothetical protein